MTRALLTYVFINADVVTGVSWAFTGSVRVRVCVYVCQYSKTKPTGQTITELGKWIVRKKSWSFIFFEIKRSMSNVKCQSRREFALFCVPILYLTPSQSTGACSTSVSRASRSQSSSLTISSHVSPILTGKSVLYGVLEFFSGRNVTNSAAFHHWRTVALGRCIYMKQPTSKYEFLGTGFD